MAKRKWDHLRKLFDDMQFDELVEITEDISRKSLRYVIDRWRESQPPNIQVHIPTTGLGLVVIKTR